jgi:hypothetical protein
MSSIKAPVESPPFPFDAAAEKRARVALVEAARRYEETQTVLFSTITECVRALRKQGMSPEAMVITMKAFVRHAAFNEPGSRGTVARPLMDQVIEWCIHEYYRVD